MNFFKPFNISSMIPNHSDVIAEQVRKEAKLKRQFEDALEINFIYEGNVQQFKFLYELACSDLCNRRTLVLGANKYLSSTNSLAISRFARAITKAVRNGISNLERNINSDLLTSKIFSKRRNLRSTGALRFKLDISIGTDLVQANELVATDFYGARLSNSVGSFFFSDDLSEDMTKWISALILVLSGKGFGYITVADALEQYHSWYIEEFYSVFHAKLKLDERLLDPLYAYIQEIQAQVDNVEDDDKEINFSLDKFAKLHSQALVPSEIPQYMGNRESKEQYDLSFKTIKKCRKIHASKLRDNLKNYFGDDFQTYKSMIDEVKFRKQIEDDFSVYLEIREKHNLQYQDSLDTQLNALLCEIPNPKTVLDSNIYEYIKVALPKAVNHLVMGEVDGATMDCNEVHAMSTVVYGSVHKDHEEEVCNILNELQEIAYESEEPFSYIRDPNLLIQMLREHFVVNAILTSVGELGCKKGLQSFY